MRTQRDSLNTKASLSCPTLRKTMLSLPLRSNQTKGLPLVDVLKAIRLSAYSISSPKVMLVVYEEPSPAHPRALPLKVSKVLSQIKLFFEIRPILTPSP